MDLALNNLQRLICHKTHQTKPIGALLSILDDFDDAVVWMVSILSLISPSSSLFFSSL